MPFSSGLGSSRGRNLLFRLYVGQEWLSPDTLSAGGAAPPARSWQQEEEEEEEEEEEQDVAGAAVIVTRKKTKPAGAFSLSRRLVFFCCS